MLEWASACFSLRRLLYNSRMPFSDAFSPPHKSKSPPPDTTNQEAAHLKLLVEKKTPVSIKMVDGEVVNGWIEYYDRNMLRLTREGKPNLFIFKNQIAYVAE
jgi:host factor-I protein